jgi:hypothetical protein
MAANFLSSLNEWINKGSNPSPVIFKIVKEQVKRFTNRQISYQGNIDLRGFLDLESYNDYLESKLWEEKLLKGGFAYIIQSSSNEQHALRNLNFLISQMNDQLGLQNNPDIDNLITLVKDHIENLFQEYFSISDRIFNKSEITLIKELDLETAKEIILQSKRQNKDYRIRLTYELLNQFTSNEKLSFSDLIKNLKEQIGITDTSTQSLNFKNDGDEDQELELAEKDSDSISIINKEFIKKKLDDFSESLTEPEFLVLINWLDVKYEKLDENKKESFNKRQIKLSQEIGLEKSAIYQLLSNAKNKLISFLKKFEDDEKAYIINLITTMIEENKK